ncbi:MAG: hypothetical protein FWE36_07625 [Erysipelotrichales bacterium]|nr:hypothetical protein [Erysipelotrichales bacterium]
MFKKHLVPVLMMLLGANLLAIGSNFFVFSRLGGDPIYLFNEALSRQLGVEFGTAFLIHNAAYFILLIVLDKRRIGIMTFLVVFGVGPIINLYANIFVFPEHIVLRVLFSLIGALSIGIGVGIFISLNYGLPPFEGIMIWLSKKTNFSIKKTRYILDACYLLLALLIGGALGVGVIIAFVLLGPTIEYSHKFFRRTILPEPKKQTEDSETG